MMVARMIDGQIVDVAEDDPRFPQIASRAAFVPESISYRQFAEGLWGDGLISFDECEAFVSTGTPPASLQTIIDSLPDDNTGTPTPRKQAVILVRGAQSYDRHNSLTETIRQVWAAQDARWTSDFLDARWTAWSKL